jgi:2'-5' RNA ligase
MHVTVELLFAPASADLLYRKSTELQRQYGPPPDPAYTAPPHIRLVSLEEEPDFLRSTVDGHASGLEAFDLNLDSVATFPQGVVYLAPSDNAQMISIHAALHRDLADRGVRSNWPYYQPGQWKPHCTVAVGISQDRIDDAVTWFRKVIPILVRVESLAVLSYQPFSELHKRNLGRTLKTP